VTGKGKDWSATYWLLTVRTVFERRIIQDNFPLPLFQEMSRYENHIESGLATKNGVFQGVSRLLTTLHVLESTEFAIFDRTLRDQGLKSS